MRKCAILWDDAIGNIMWHCESLMISRPLLCQLGPGCMRCSWLCCSIDKCFCQGDSRAGPGLQKRGHTAAPRLRKRRRHTFTVEGGRKKKLWGKTAEEGGLIDSITYQRISISAWRSYSLGEFFVKNILEIHVAICYTTFLHHENHADVSNGWCHGTKGLK